MIRLFVLFLIGLSCAFLKICAEDEALISLEQKGSIPSNVVPQTPKLRAVILVSDVRQVVTHSLKRYEGVNVVGNLTIPGTLQELKVFFGEDLFQQPITEELIVEARSRIIDYYTTSHRPFLFIVTPEQDLNEGVLQFVVIESKLGEVRVVGNRYFFSKNFIKGLNVQPGRPIQGRDVQSDLMWMNRTPFHHTDVIFVPGKSPGTTDIELLVKDRLPFRPYVGMDNTGISQTGNIRLFAGFNAPLFFDHTFSYQYTTSTDFKKLQAHTIGYILPFKGEWDLFFLHPKYHTLMIFGGYAVAQPEITEFRSKGRAIVASVRYNMAPPDLRRFPSMTGIGFDFKRFNNNLVFAPAEGTAPVINKNVNLTQFVLPLAWGNVLTSWYHFAVLADIAFSPMSWLPDQSNQAFQNLRPFAKHKYIYFRPSVTQTFTLPHKVRIISRVSGQISSNNLLPSEQLSAGGYNTVRGYKERIVLRDNGLITNLEVYAPPLSFTGNTERDALDFLAFFDYALMADHRLEPGERPSIYLMGIGPGLRYRYREYLSTRFDWGIPLHHVKDFDLSDGTHSRVYFSLILSY